MLGWGRYGFDKNRIGTHYIEHVFLHPLGSAGHVVHFGASMTRNVGALFSCLVEPVCIRRKARRDMFRQTCVSTSGGICGPRSAFRCVGGAKCQHTFFMIGWDRYGYDKKRAGTHDAELVFLHPVGSTGHAVHSIASRARIIDELFFMLEWHWYCFDKKACQDKLC
jgi:hypothetical protein